MSTIMIDEEAKKMEEMERQAHDQNLKEQRKSIAAQKRMAMKRKNSLSKEEAEIKIGRASCRERVSRLV